MNIVNVYTIDVQIIHSTVFTSSLNTVSKCHIKDTFENYIVLRFDVCYYCYTGVYVFVLLYCSTYL